MLLTAVLTLCVLFLLLRLLLLRHSIREVADELDEKLKTDTNTLISISTGDRASRTWPHRSMSSLRRFAESVCGCKMETRS